MTTLTPDEFATLRGQVEFRIRNPNDHVTSAQAQALLSELDRLRKRLEEIEGERDAYDGHLLRAIEERDSARAELDAALKDGEQKWGSAVALHSRRVHDLQTELSRVMPVVEAAINLFEDEEGAVKLRAALDALPQAAVAGPVAYLLCACGQRSVSVSGEPLCEACIKAWAERLAGDLVAAGEAERIAGPVGEQEESQ